MKDSGEHHKNVITIQGSVVKIELPDIYLKVAQVTSSNMIKEDSNWVQNQSVVKKPPYDIGETYAFRFKNNAIDNLVSTGLNQVYFESP